MGEIRRTSRETYLAAESKRVLVVRGGHVAKHQGQATKRFTKNQTAKNNEEKGGNGLRRERKVNIEKR